MDLIRDKMARGVVKDHMPARDHIARCVVKGSFVRGHSHLFVNHYDVTAQVVDVLILFL